MCSSAPENWSFLFCFLQFIFFVLLCVCCCCFLPRGAVVYIIVPNKMGNLDWFPQKASSHSGAVHPVDLQFRLTFFSLLHLCWWGAGGGGETWQKTLEAVHHHSKWWEKEKKESAFSYIAQHQDPAAPIPKLASSTVLCIYNGGGGGEEGEEDPAAPIPKLASSTVLCIYNGGGGGEEGEEDPAAPIPKLGFPLFRVSVMGGGGGGSHTCWKLLPDLGLGPMSSWSPKSSVLTLHWSLHLCEAKSFSIQTEIVQGIAMSFMLGFCLTYMKVLPLRCFLKRFFYFIYQNDNFLCVFCFKADFGTWC